MANKSTSSVLGTVHGHANALRKHCQEAYDQQKPMDKAHVRSIAHQILAATESPVVAQDGKVKGAAPPVDMGF